MGLYTHYLLEVGPSSEAWLAVSCRADASTQPFALQMGGSQHLQRDLGQTSREPPDASDPHLPVAGSQQDLSYKTITRILLSSFLVPEW